MVQNAGKFSKKLEGEISKHVTGVGPQVFCSKHAHYEKSLCTPNIMPVTRLEHSKLEKVKVSTYEPDGPSGWHLSPVSLA